MEKIKVKKEDLLKVLNENKLKHLEDYALAIEGYKLTVIKLLSDKLKKIKNLDVTDAEEFKEFNLYNLHEIKPENHVDDFDTVIGMLTITIEDEIYITTQEYKRFYLGDWDWRNNWYVTNSGYIGVAGAAGIQGTIGVAGK